MTALLKPFRSWVVTGGIASGKSSVIAGLKARLAEIAAFFSSDESVHRLYDEAKTVEKITRLLGSNVLVDGRLSRELIAKLVFKDKGLRRDLEKILHPAVLSDLEDQRTIARTQVNLFVAEVPLYYEIGATVAADLVIVVASSPTCQVRRLMQHRGLDQARSEAVLASQLPVLEKTAKASVVIWNDGTEEALEDQIAALLDDHAI